MADITFTIEFDDQGNPVLKNIKRNAEDAGRGAENAAKRAESGFSKFQATIVTVNQALRLGTSIVRGLARITSSLVDVIQDLAAAGAAQEDAEAKRNAALRSAGQLTRDYVDELNAQAAAFQQVTKFGDETVIELQQQLIAFGATRDNIKEVTEATLDLSAGMGVDLKASALLMGKALAGEFSTLSRYGIFVDENASVSEKLAQAIDQINQRFGGQARAQAETYAGRIAQLTNSWGDLKEELGLAITQNKSLIDVIGAVKDVVANLTSFVKENKDEIQKWVSQGVLIAIDAAEALAGGIGLLSKAMLFNVTVFKALRDPRNFVEIFSQSQEQLRNLTDLLDQLPEKFEEFRRLAREGFGISTGGFKDQAGGLRNVVDAAEDAGQAAGQLNQFQQAFVSLMEERRRADEFDQEIRDKIIDRRTALVSEISALEKTITSELLSENDRRVQGIRDEAEERLTAVQSALDAQVISATQAADLIVKINESMTDKMKDQTEDLNQFWINAMRSMQSAMSDFLVDPLNGDFENLADNFKRTIDRMVADLLASQLLDATFGDKFAKGGQLGGVAGSVAGSSFSGIVSSFFPGPGQPGFGLPISSIFGIPFHEGGIVGAGDVAVRMVEPAMYRHAQRYQTGGFAGLAPNEVPAILHRGEEVLTEDDPRHARRRGRRGGINITMNISTQDANSFVRSRSQVEGVLMRAVSRGRRKN